MQLLTSLFASIVSIPFILLFFTVWIASSLYRPFVVLSWIAFLSQPTAAWRKAQLLWNTVLFLAFNKDKKWNKKAVVDPAPFFSSGAAANKEAEDSSAGTSSSIIESKTIIFVRHGESNWNETFNKGSDRSTLSFLIGFVPGLIKALFYEWYYAVSGRASGSWFYDSPLSTKGYRQALAVQAFLKSPVEYMTPKEAQVMKILHGKSPEEKEAVAAASTTGDKDEASDSDNKTIIKKKKKKRRSSVLVSSNLRRAIATMACGFQDRLLFDDDNHHDHDDSADNNDDQIFILQSLQEISFNPDALSITPPYTKVALDDNIPRLLAVDESSIGSTAGSGANSNITSSSSNSPDALLLHPARLNRIYQDKIAVSLSHGNKSLHSNGLQRLQAFCHEIFNEPQLKEYSAVIAGGHSLWFKAFFQTFLPHSTDHIAKRKKLINGGIVAFTLQRIRVAEPSASASSSSTSQILQEQVENTAASTDDTKSTKDDEYQYMIDPSSIVVVHGGF
jgi:hypothetical protein